MGVRVTYCSATRETGPLMQSLMYGIDDKHKVMINLGYGNWTGEKDFKDAGYKIVNTVEAINNCVDKKKMFGLLKAKGVPCLDYFDLTEDEDIADAAKVFSRHRKLVLRELGVRDYPIVKSQSEFFTRIMNNEFDYATTFERKRMEWRALCYKGQVFKLMLKSPDDSNVFALKLASSTWRRKRRFSPAIRTICKKAQAALGIDLCGIDICLTHGRKLKIIEVNSGMALNKQGIRMFRERLARDLASDETAAAVHITSAVVPPRPTPDCKQPSIAERLKRLLGR